MAGFSFDFRSLRVRLVLAFLAITGLTLLAVGLPLLWLVRGQPATSGLADETAIWQVLIAGAGIVGAAALLAGYFFAGRITAPLERLAAASESMGRGNLTTPIPSRPDVSEIAGLAATLETMRRRLYTAYDDLARSKAWSDNLISSIVEGVLTLDEAGRITSFSAGAERILGWRSTDVVGRSFETVFQSASVEKAAPGTVLRRSVTTKEGNNLVLLITSGAVTRHADGTTEQAFVIRDVTREEEDLRLREFFLANVSHELKTPLSSLRASVELLAGEQDSLTHEEESELVNSLWLGTLRLEELVDNLLSSASIRSGHFQINARPVELPTILREIALTSKPLLALQGQTLDLQIPATLPPVLADPRRLNQVLINLISNASKYGPPDSPITVCVEPRGEQVIVSVVDRGQTIAAEEQSGLFQPFRPGDSSASGGIGLGLSIVQNIVESQGGSLGIKPAPGGGNAFWFTLDVPRRAEQAALPSASESIRA